MEPQLIVRLGFGLISLAGICWLLWEGWKMYKVHQYYKRRREAYARINDEIEAIEKKAQEENGNV